MIDIIPLFEITVLFLVLIPFIIGNLFFAIGSLIQKRLYAFLEKKLNLDEKKSHSRILNSINLIAWISIGIVLVISLDYPISIDGLFIFLAFRNGLILTKRVILGVNDLRIMKSKLPENKYIKIASLAVKISVIIELILIIAWALSYRYINTSVKSSLGIDINLLVIFFWITGLAYGTITSLIASYFSSQFLLKGEIGIILLISGVTLKDRVEKKFSFMSKS